MGESSPQVPGVSSLEHMERNKLERREGKQVGGGVKLRLRDSPGVLLAALGTGLGLG